MHTAPAPYPSGIGREARDRIEAFWAGSSLGDRPALHVTWRDRAATRRTWTGEGDRLLLDRDPDYQAWCALGALDEHPVAEAVPRTYLGFGSNVALLPALLGHPYTYSAGTAWVHPVADIYAKPPPAFDPDTPLLRDLAACLRAMDRALAGRAALTPPPLGLDALTCLSLLRGGEALCEDLVDDPERVEAWLAPARAYWCGLAHHLHDLVRRLGHGGSSSWLHTWAPGRCEALQCDAATMFSRPMFRRFVLPELEAAAACLDHAIYHLDGTCQLRFLDELAGVPGLRGIQWNPEPGANDIADPRWIEAFRAIRARGLVLQFNAWESRTVEQVLAVVRALGPDGLMFALPPFAGEDEAREAVARIARG